MTQQRLNGMRKLMSALDRERGARANRNHPSILRLSTIVLGALSIFALAVLLPIRMQAQVLYGTLIGNVTDSTSAEVVGANVEATNTGTGITETATTDKNGAFRFSELEPGTYKVTVSAKTFASALGQDILIQANSERRFDAVLKAQSVAQTIMVTAAPPELQTDNATVSSNLEAAQLESIIALPGVNERNFQSLYMVLPGFTPPGPTHSESGNPSQTMLYNVNGISGSNNNTRIDGVSDIYPWLPEIAAYVPSTEAIAAVNVVTNSYNAEQGFASGTVVNVTTKSGTNRFGGTAWEYNTISALEAIPYFNTTKPKYIMNQFGANYGGPIKKDKAFFFSNWERTRRSQAFSGFETVPTANMLAGNFSGLVTKFNGADVPVTIYDPGPTSGPGSPYVLNPTGANRTPFQGNIIPASRLSAPAAYAAQQMIKLLQANNNKDAPNVPIAADNFTNNFFSAVDSEYVRDNIDSRVDYIPNTKNSIFGRYGIQKTNLFDPQPLGAAEGSPYDGGQPGNAPSIIQSVGIGATHTFTPNVLLDANIGYLRQGMAAKNTDIGVDWGTSYFNIPGTNGTCSLCGGMPWFTPTGIANLGDQNHSNPFQFRDNTYTTAANLSWIKGKNSLRFGMEFQRYAINHFQPQNVAGPRGGFSFNGDETVCTNCIPSGQSTFLPATAYNGWADFLLGLPSSIAKDTAFYNPQAIRENVWAFYAQNQWQATPKLTVNYGARYEYYPLANTNRTGLNIFNPSDGLIYEGGVNGIPKNAGVSVGRGMIVPRLGFAYRIDSKTVARAGIGIVSNPDSYRNVLTSFPAVLSQSISGNTSYEPALNGTQVLSLDVGIPPVPINAAQTLSTNGTIALGPLGTPAGTLGANTIPLNYKRGYYESYNVALERELPGAITLNATYVGDFIVRENPGININANQAPGQTKAQMPFNALYGISAGITSYIPDGTGHYNALQAQAMRRFANRSSVGVNYTYSHAINDYGDQSDGESSLTIAMQAKPYWRLNRATAGFDRTHNLQVFGNYMLPFGKGQAYLQNGAAGYILGGWQVSGSMSKESGTPFTVTGNGATLGPSTSGSTQFGDVISKSHMILGGHSPGGGRPAANPYFNTANFQDPAVAEGLLVPGGCSASTPANIAACRFGTAGKNSLRGPGFFNSSVSLGRNFLITERFSFALRCEAMNVTNTPSFANPNSTDTSSSFGLITGTSGSYSPRTVRLSGRVTF